MWTGKDELINYLFLSRSERQVVIGYTAVWLQFTIYSCLRKGTFSNYFCRITAACYLSEPGMQTLQMEWKKRKWNIQQEKSPKPQEGAPHALIPRVSQRTRESVLISPAPLSISLFLSLCHLLGLTMQWGLFSVCREPLHSPPVVAVSSCTFCTTQWWRGGWPRRQCHLQ